MSAAIPPVEPPRQKANTSPRLALVVAYRDGDSGIFESPAGEAIDAQDGDARDGMIAQLREQIVMLAEHYARDVARLQDALEGKERDATRAWSTVSEMHTRLSQANKQLAGSRKEVVRLREALYRTRHELELTQLSVDARDSALIAQRQRAELLKAALGTRWWQRSLRRELQAAASILPDG